MRQSLIVPFACFLLLPVFSPSVFAVEIITGFSPSGTAQTVVLDAIQEAKHTINLAAYSFTSKPVSLALLAAQKRGVVVRVLADEKANSTQYTAVTFLANQGVSVRLNRRYKIMHNKFAVIGGSTPKPPKMWFIFAAVRQRLRRTPKNLIVCGLRVIRWKAAIRRISSKKMDIRSLFLPKENHNEYICLSP